MRQRMIITLSVLMLFCSSCGKTASIPEGMTEKAYQTGMELVSVCDDYLAMKIDRIEFAGKLVDINSGFDSKSIDAEKYPQDLSLLIDMTGIMLGAEREDDDLVKEWYGKLIETMGLSN